MATPRAWEIKSFCLERGDRTLNSSDVAWRGKLDSVSWIGLSDPELVSVRDVGALGTDHCWMQSPSLAVFGVELGD